MKEKIFTVENIIRLIVACLLFISLNMKWSDFDDYSVIVRWMTFCVSGYAAIKYLRKIEDGWIWTFSAIALFYNPIFQANISRDFQEIINVIVGIFLIFSIFITTFKDSWKINFKLFFKS